jgi:hypothetical protein
MMRRFFLLVLSLFLFGPTRSRAAEPPPPLWVVVTAPAFRQAVEPLCARRKAEGMQVVVVQTTDVLSPKEILAGDARKLRDKVNELCRQARGDRYVLLVGAVEPGGPADADRKVLPPLAGTVSRMKGEPSDNGYGCLGQGLLPEVAVGRFPARTEEEARQMVRKTVDYEDDRRPGDWKRRLTVLAGVPALNPTLDQLAEKMALTRLAKFDLSWTGRVIYYNPQSAFCLPDGALHARARQYVEQGQALTLYLGHSDARALYAGRARFLDRDDWARLKIARGPGLFVTFGCLGCQLKGEGGEGYGVAALRNPDGPVAVVGSHQCCFAAMAELAADGFLQSFFGPDPPERLGASWLRLKQNLAKKPLQLYFHQLDKADGDPRIPPATQRLEHLEMFVLLGDPALKIPTIPQDVKLSVADPVAPGGTVTVRGELPARLAGARVRVRVERPTNSQAAELQPLPKGGAKDEAPIMLANHQRANNFVVAEEVVTARDGRFEARLRLPEKMPWRRLTVRAYAETDKADGLGVLSAGVETP